MAHRRPLLRAILLLVAKAAVGNVPCLEAAFLLSFPSSNLRTAWSKASSKLSRWTTSSVTPDGTVESAKVTEEADLPTPSTRDSNSIHLLSLKSPSWSNNDIDNTPKFSKVVADVWQWKDAVLGDGRDFFVPKPKTLAALQSAMVNSCDQIQECIVLSNCARFEILLCAATRDDSHNSPPLNTEDDPVHLVSQVLLEQVHSYQNRQTEWPVHLQVQQQLGLSLDWPEVIVSPMKDDTTAIWREAEKNAAVTELSHQDNWMHLETFPEIARHLCGTAAGIIPHRPRRPDRPTPFRPFSSRDAHILLQLKRTLEIAQRQQHASSQPQDGKASTTIRNQPASVLPLLLRYALQAGKAARSVSEVPELEQLRQYGTGNSKRYSMEPPPQVLDRVTQAAMDRAVDPTVAKCIEAIQAMDRAESIASFRSRCESLAQSDEELQWIRRHALHAPTLQLRKGVVVNETAIVQELAKELKHELPSQKLLNSVYSKH